MRTLIVSDIHSNVVAFDAVLAAAREDGPIDRVWCLGDVVGYGPEPMGCIERLWALDAVVICGNHDAVAVGRIDISTFNGPAADAVRWNGARLSAEARDYLRALPETVDEAPFTLVHGTPRNPMWEYLTRGAQAEQAWGAISTPAVLVYRPDGKLAKRFDNDDAEKIEDEYTVDDVKRQISKLLTK